MEVEKEDLKKIYDTFKPFANQSSDTRNAILMLEKWLGLPPFSHLSNEELRRHKCQTHSAVLASIGFKVEEPSKSQGKPDRINRYKRGFY
jgi:hypothetical protein